MHPILGLGFLTCAAGILIVYPMYFIELANFKRLLLRDHAGLVSCRLRASSRIDSAATYKILKSVKSRSLDGEPLSPEAAASYSYARRLLYTGSALFMVFLASGLWESLRGA